MLAESDVEAGTSLVTATIADVGGTLAGLPFVDTALQPVPKAIVKVVC